MGTDKQETFLSANTNRLGDFMKLLGQILDTWESTGWLRQSIAAQHSLELQGFTAAVQDIERSHSNDCSCWFRKINQHLLDLVYCVRCAFEMGWSACH